MNCKFWASILVRHIIKDSHYNEHVQEISSGSDRNFLANYLKPKTFIIHELYNRGTDRLRNAKTRYHSDPTILEKAYLFLVIFIVITKMEVFPF